MAHGPAVTTKEVAEAAGIAEGTLFRVFPTKSDLMCAVIENVVDPADVVTALAALEPATLTEATRSILEVLRDNVRSTSAFFQALHASGAEGPRDPARKNHKGPPDQQEHSARLRTVTDAIAAVLAPHEDSLRVPTEQAASLIHTLALATLHPFLAGMHLDDLDEVNSLMLHGFAQENA